MIAGTPSPIVSTKALCLLVAGCVLSAWFFVPDNEELVDRLGKDGHFERLKAMADEDKAVEVVPTTDEAKMKTWIESREAADLEDTDLIAQQKILCSITERPVSVGDELFKGSKRLDPDLFAELVEDLARRALGLQRPAEAGQLLSRLNQAAPTWELTSRAMQAWRWGVRSDEALKTLDAALAAGLDRTTVPEDIDSLRETLALESNQPNIAFDIVLKKYRAAAPAKRMPLLRRLLDLANAGDRTTEASNLIAEYLAKVPFHTCTLDEAISLVQSNKAFVDAQSEADYREYATSFAHWREWDGHAEQAIDTWFRLALLSHNEAWERCKDIAEDVLRMDDFTKVLAFRIEHGLSKNDEAQLAGLLLDQGRVEEALEHYQSAAEHAPNPTTALRAIARIHQQACEWEAAIAAFDRLLEWESNDLEAGKSRAFALVRLGRYEEAHTSYVSLAAAHPEDAEVQQTCAALCDSLGYADDARAATLRALKLPHNDASPEDFLELAANCRATGAAADEVATLRAGLEHFASSHRLRISLAESLGAQGQHDEAVKLLSHESLRDDPAAMDLLVSEGMDMTNGEPVAAFLHDAVPACFSAVPEAQLRVGFLLEHVHHEEQASTVMASLLRNSSFRADDTWRRLGEQCLDAGDSARAESFITLYLASAGANDGKAWELLGDIYQSLDRAEEALTAYRKAVEVIRPSGTEKPPPMLKVSQIDRLSP